MKKILLFAVLALVAAGCDRGKKGELVTENYSIVDSVLLRDYVKTIPENSAAKCSVMSICLSARNSNLSEIPS